LRLVFAQPHASWAELVARLDPDRRPALLAGDLEALDQLAAELNELREITPRR
jgi:hypothetical protein